MQRVAITFSLYKIKKESLGSTDTRTPTSLSRYSYVNKTTVKFNSQDEIDE